jgi:DtxR family Mn-dependent transcriptional regulator
MELTQVLTIVKLGVLMSQESSWSNIKSEALENYLKTIFLLTSSGIDASVQEISTRVGVSAAGVSKMLKHLAKHRLVHYVPYQPVVLTELGERVAVEVVRHHRLLEVYLMETLGYGWEKVHSEAERLEHHISEEFEDAIDRLLGFPAFDPHGDPIPTRDGRMPRPVTSTLEAQVAGSAVVIRRVTDEDEALLIYFAERGLRPGTVLSLVDREPFGGSLHLHVNGQVVRITPQAARNIFVEPAEENVARVGA